MVSAYGNKGAIVPYHQRWRYKQRQFGGVIHKKDFNEISKI